MKKIKYRAHYKPTDEIYYNAFRTPFFKNDNFHKFRWSAITKNGQCIALEKENIILMQYINRKDNDNKEIYEYDVVSNGAGDIFVVIWNERNCEFVLLDKNNQIHNVNKNFLKIVGNIFKEKYKNKFKNRKELFEYGRLESIF